MRSASHHAKTTSASWFSGIGICAEKIRFMAWVIFVSFVITLSVAITSEAMANSRYASMIMEESSGRVLFSRNAHKQLYPASLTKIMTLYLLFEALQTKKVTLATKMRVSHTAASRSPSKLYLKPGQSISVKHAILALVTKSANDVATTISEHLAGSERAFAKQMTRKARALGMSRTTFKNASGLPNRAQLSTAHDMARLGVAVRRDFPQYFYFFSERSFSWNGRKYKSHNKLLANFKGTDGIKTGYTNASGFNLVATTERNGVRLVGVVFGGKTGGSRDKHMIDLLSRQFKQVKPIQVKSSALPASPPPRPKLPVQIASVSKDYTKNKVSKPAPKPDISTPLEKNLPAIIVAQAEWAIQVGSYSRRISAHKAAIKARRAANKILYFMPANLALVTKGDLPLWRVRFGQLDEQEARTACAALVSAGVACIALPPALIDAS